MHLDGQCVEIPESLEAYVRAHLEQSPTAHHDQVQCLLTGFYSSLSLPGPYAITNQGQFTINNITWIHSIFINQVFSKRMPGKGKSKVISHGKKKGSDLLLLNLST